MTIGQQNNPPPRLPGRWREGSRVIAERGLKALYGVWLRKAAHKLEPHGATFLAPGDLATRGRDLLRTEGATRTLAALLRHFANAWDPPERRRALMRARQRRAAPGAYFYTDELTKPDGVVPSRRLKNDLDFALETPFAGAWAVAPPGPIAAVVHAYYPEALPVFLEKLRHIPAPVDLFLSTDTPQKTEALRQLTETWSKGAVEIRTLPNRGRDIAAKFVGFADVYDRYDVFLHLHTKKSTHGGEQLAVWRDYLLDALVGTPEVAASNLGLFADPAIGIVFPQHLSGIRGIINWGYDYDHARRLMRRMGVEIDKNMPLEFPSGSMFWGRSAAIRPLLDLGLTWDDFPAENGQVDGTIAHAIERIVLMCAEHAGFEWLKVVRRGAYPWPDTILEVTSRDDLARHRLKVYQPCLAPVDGRAHEFARDTEEARPLAGYPSRNRRPRLTLLTPTVNPKQTFGGVATALRVFEQLASALAPDFDRRIVVTDAAIEPDGYAALPGYAPLPCAPGLDTEPATLVDAYERETGRIDLRGGDIFMATAWWTAAQARALEATRRRFFAGRAPLIYLIQDDEPYFYGRGAKFALAEATYDHGEDTIAIINSEELFGAMTRKHAFRAAFCLPYAINEQIAAALTPRPRERIVLVYGRPSVARNAFSAICAGLYLWQQRDPVRASRWRIVFLGEAFDAWEAEPVQNVVVPGKLDLAGYADYLNRASVGVALMVSPHPSYAPLEMAEAGLATVANSFPGKDVRRRFADILAVDALTAEELATAIERAVERMEPRIGCPGARVAPLAQDTPSPFDAAAIAALIGAAAPTPPTREAPSQTPLSPDQIS